MSRPKRTSGAAQHPPASGQVDAGVPFDPASIAPAPPGEAAAEPPRDRAMPAPQGPLPTREIERLKARAAKSTVVAPVAGQRDPAAKLRRK